MINEEKRHGVQRKIRSIIGFYRWKIKFARWGKGSCIYAPDRLIGCNRIWIGSNVNILHHARIETIQSYGEQLFESKLMIGDDTYIGQNLHIVAAGELIIGNNVTISGNVYISDVEHQYKSIDIHVSKQKLCQKMTAIGDNCFIGFGAAILPGVHLGKQCIVGANAVVREGNYPDYSVIAGIPAKVIRKYDPIVKKWIRV